MKIDVGELNRKIEILKKVVTRTSDGYKSEDTVPVRVCYAKFSRQSGTETLRAGADLSEVKVRFLVRWSSAAIDRKMLVRYGGDEYEIEFINDYNDSHEFIELWCSKTTTAR